MAPTTQLRKLLAVSWKNFSQFLNLLHAGQSSAQDIAALTLNRVLPLAEMLVALLRSRVYSGTVTP